MLLIINGLVTHGAAKSSGITLLFKRWHGSSG